MSLANSMHIPPGAVSKSVGPSLPVSFLKEGESGTVLKISGNDEVRKFLAELGFVQGTVVKAVCNNNTGLILDVRGSRVALDKVMGQKIHITQ